MHTILLKYKNNINIFNRTLNRKYYVEKKKLNVYIYSKHTHQGNTMRTNVIIDDILMKNARQLSGMKTKRETIESALKLLIKVKSQAFIKKYRGRLKWEGDLENMRKD
jgi:Arc/MetJ family transcription regulator